MRILVYEFASGGGLAGQQVPVSIAREGSAMLTALVTDLATLQQHQIVTTTDPRFPLAVPMNVEVVTMSAGQTALLDTLIASAEAVWLVAPETDCCLERLSKLKLPEQEPWIVKSKFKNGAKMFNIAETSNSIFMVRPDMKGLVPMSFKSPISTEYWDNDGSPEFREMFARIQREGIVLER